MRASKGGARYTHLAYTHAHEMDIIVAQAFLKFHQNIFHYFLQNSAFRQLVHTSDKEGGVMSEKMQRENSEVSFASNLREIPSPIHRRPGPQLGVVYGLLL